MKSLKLVLVALVSFVMVTTSCKKDDTEDPITVSSSIDLKDIVLSRKTDYGNDWIYYSFAEAKEVEVADHMTSTAWDIAFNRYNVRTNGGESGTGQAGVYDAGQVDFTSFTTAPESGYIVDDTILIVEAFTGQGVDWMTSTGNDAFKGCVELVYGAGPPSYTPNDHIFVVKTADGKYAKLWVKAYYNAAGESGYMNIKYAYQKDGSMSFE